MWCLAYPTYLFDSILFYVPVEDETRTLVCALHYNSAKGIETLSAGFYKLAIKVNFLFLDC